jgi:hypothetical protein
MYDLVIVPEGNLWKTFGPIHIYAPPQEYILALKIFAGRDKDIEDCTILLKQGEISSRQNNAETIARSLDIHFGKQRLQSEKNDGAEP